MMKLIFGDKKKDYGPGWISVDTWGADHNITLDEDTRLHAFSDGSIDMIYSSHMIEHMSDKAVQNFFNESYRILRGGAGLRICAPDAMYYIDSYNTAEKDAFFKDEYAVGTGRTLEEVVMLKNPEPVILEAHNLLCTIFCCYIDNPQYCHIHKRKTVEGKLSKGVDAFISWATSYYIHSRPGGHRNGFYVGKTIKMMKKAGFGDAFKGAFRRSSFEEFVINPNLDLVLRKNNSFYVEAIR